jgi:Phosphatidylinositol-4-phosphate 5-Kinase
MVGIHACRTLRRIPCDIGNLQMSHLGGHRHGNEVYYMGIIDVLQEYNIRKHAETAIKVITSLQM